MRKPEKQNTIDALMCTKEMRVVVMVVAVVVVVVAVRWILSPLISELV